MPKTPKPQSDDEPIQRGVFYALDALTPHPENYNHHPEQQIGDLCASLTEFGQVDDIVVWPRTDGGKSLTYIIGGEGIWTAAGRLEMAGLYATVLPATWTYAKAKRYLMANNTLSRHADPDMTQLAAMLEEQRNAGYHLESLGFSDDDLTALLEQLANEALDDAGASRTTELGAPAGGAVEEHYSVLVECVDEAEQQRAYNLLTAEGFTCRVLTL